MANNSGLNGESVRPQTDGREEEAFEGDSYFVFPPEDAERLVREALDTVQDEPEGFVRLLLTLHDHAREPRLSDSIYLLMKVAYNNSLVHSIDFQEYLEAVRA